MRWKMASSKCKMMHEILEGNVLHDITHDLLIMSVGLIYTKFKNITL